MVYSQFEQRNMDTTFNFGSRPARKDFNENDKTFCYFIFLGRYCIRPMPMAALIAKAPADTHLAAPQLKRSKKITVLKYLL